MKDGIIKNTLYKSGLYPNIKSHAIYDFYKYMLKKNFWEKEKIQVSFYRNTINKNDNILIFDIGANRGDKADIFRRFANKIICVEPDKKNIDFMRKRFKSISSIEIVPKAIDSHICDKEFYINNIDSAFNTLNIKWKKALETQNRFNIHFDFYTNYSVHTTTIDELIATYGMPDYIKIDVEGYELHAIQGLSHTIPFISFEANLPEFKEETIECSNLLSKLSKRTLFSYSQD